MARDIAIIEAEITNAIGDAATPCTQLGVEKILSDLREELAEAKEAAAIANAPFANVTFILRLASGTMIPTLQTTNAPLAAAIIASGRRPATLEIDGITVSTVGSTTTLSVAGVNDPLEVAGLLTTFGESKGILVDATAANQTIQSNIIQRDVLTTVIGIQTSIVEALVGLNPIVEFPEADVAALGDLEVITDWSGDDNLAVTVAGSITHVDNVFTGTKAADFAGVITSGHPNGAFTAISINVKEILLGLGVVGPVWNTQVNPAMNLAYGAGTFPADTKNGGPYPLSGSGEIDDEFNILLASGGSATLTFFSDPARTQQVLVISIDAGDLVVSVA